ncbi:MAG: hydroxyacid dehydrogenase [Flavobacteriales bacterium]|nr:hydroxyacid dehydrogenase [Flavobacteriales bacterium]
MRVLFLDSVHEILQQELEANGFVCDHDYSSSYADIKSKIASYDGIVIRSRIPVDRGLLAAGMLKFVARSGAGLENIDLAAANELGTQIFSSPEGNMDAVAEHAIGMLLMLMNHLKRADAEVRAGVWRRAENRGTEVKGKTVGIIGYGHMGSAFAQRLSGFGCTIIAHDKYKHGFGNDCIEEVSKDELLERSDIISIHLPLSDETRHYVDSSFILAAGKPFILINTARGLHVDIAALLDGLESGKVVGACLDVLEFEKSSFESIDTDHATLFQQLIARADVVLSPHIAGWTHESYVKLSSFLAKKIVDQFG